MTATDINRLALKMYDNVIIVFLVPLTHSNVNYVR